MSVQAISWALSVQTGSPGAKLVLVALANYADQHGVCWPSQALLVRQTEQSMDSVQRRLAELVERGLLGKKIRRRQSTLYQLLMPEAKKPQDAVSSASDDRTEIKKPQNPVKKPQLCGTEPPLLTVNSKIDKAGFGKEGKTKPRHLQKSKDGRLWVDKGTGEWDAYLADFVEVRRCEPVLYWSGAGTWFMSAGELSRNSY